MKNTATDKEASHRVARVLTSLLLSEPFWGTLALGLEYVEDKTQKTEATDGIHVFYNPEFIKSIPVEQVKAEFCHEVNHCARLHTFRRGTRDVKLWNVACDYRINEDMFKDNYQLDDTWLRANWVGALSEEQIYAKLEQMPRPQQQKLIGQSELHGQVMDAKNGEGQDASGTSAQEWKQKLVQAAQIAEGSKGKGSIPSSLAALIDSIRNPAIDWRSATRKFLEQTSRNDFSWELPDRCYSQFGIYLPSIHSEQLPPIVFYWDTSGSRWSDESRRMAAAELVGMIREARPELTYVIYGDSKVQQVDTFTAQDEIKLNPKGGGGTDFRPIFEYVAKNELNPCCLIGITDLDGNFPTSPPEYPVLWVSDNKGATAPFGEVLYVKSF